MKRILITGEMRSGTTFLANLLNSQEDIIVYADMLLSLFMEGHALGIKNLHSPLSERERNVLFSNLIPEGKKQRIDFGVLDRTKCNSWMDIFNAALHVISDNKSPHVVGIKRTREEEYLNGLLDDGVLVIYCVRDPRDVVISSKNRFAAHNTFSAVRKWRQSVEHALSLKDHKNMYVLRYEDLISKGPSTLDGLNKFLDSKINTDLKELNYARDLTYRDNSSFGDITKLFDAKGIYRWKLNHDEETTFVGSCLQDLIARLGYEKTTDSASAIGLLKKFKKYKRKLSIRNKMRGVFNKIVGS